MRVFMHQDEALIHNKGEALIHNQEEHLDTILTLEKEA